MSRRESCVWHPMPEEVRRSSVQSRRASLAAGRRKSQQASTQPDWEVEAPATPPPADDYSPRQPAAAAAAAPATAAAPAAAATTAAQPAKAREAPVEGAYPTEDAAAATTAAQPAKAREAPVEGAYPKEDPAPVQQSRAAAEPEPEEAAPVAREPSPKVNEEEAEQPAGAEYPEEDDHAARGADDVKADSLAETDEELEGAAASDAAAGHETKKQKTRHTIRFRGASWREVMEENPEEIKAAFKEDIWDSAKVKAEEATNVKLAWDDCMVITFVMRHAKGLKRRQNAIHKKLEEYAFPKVCALYSRHDEL